MTMSHGIESIVSGLPRGFSDAGLGDDIRDIAPGYNSIIVTLLKKISEKKLPISFGGLPIKYRLASARPPVRKRMGESGGVGEYRGAEESLSVFSILRLNAEKTDAAYAKFMAEGVEGFEALREEEQYDLLKALPSPGWMIGGLERDLALANVFEKEQRSRIGEGFIPTADQAIAPIEQSSRSDSLYCQLSQAHRYANLYEQVIKYVLTESPNNSLKRLAQHSQANLAPVVFR